jgi:hypothetical protein
MYEVSSFNFIQATKCHFHEIGYQMLCFLSEYYHYFRKAFMYLLYFVCSFLGRRNIICN